MPPNIFIFCALACEAKPLIAAWQLKKLSHSGTAFSIYANAERVVVVSGVGKIAMAGAVGYVLALFPNAETPIIVNLGIAGHKAIEVGGICLGQKISDAETGRSFYPPLTFNPPCTTATVITHSKVHTAYSDDKVHEMEAAGFYEMAVKFSTSELIQVFKIISDNVNSSIEKINELLVAAWIGEKIAILDDLLNELKQLRLSSIVYDETEHLYQTILARFHFTVANGSKLKALLQRWQLLKGGELNYSDANIRSASELLRWIEQQLDESKMYL